MRLRLTAFLRPASLLAALFWMSAGSAVEPPQPTAEAIALDETIQGLNKATLTVGGTFTFRRVSEISAITLN